MTALSVVEQEIEAGKHVVEVPGDRGDTKHYYDPKDPVQVEVAKDIFHTFKLKGYAAFKMGRFGKKGDQIREFDPSVGRILFTKPLNGG